VSTLLNWEDVEGRLPEIAMGLSTYGDYLNEEVKPTAGDTARYPRRSTHGMEEKNAEFRKAGEIYCDSRETQQIFRLLLAQKLFDIELVGVDLQGVVVDPVRDYRQSRHRQKYPSRFLSSIEPSRS